MEQCSRKNETWVTEGTMALPELAQVHITVDFRKKLWHPRERWPQLAQIGMLKEALMEGARRAAS